MIGKHLAGMLLAAACAPALAADECYAPLVAGSTVTFRVSQSGSPFDGSFKRFSGEICFAQGRVTRIEATLDPASVDTGLPELDAALKDREFFAVKDYPRVSFASRSVQSKGDTHTARGTLEIKGKRREAEIVFRVKPEAGGLALAGSFSIDRLQFDIGTGEWSNTQWLGAEVTIGLKATLARRT